MSKLLNPSPNLSRQLLQVGKAAQRTGSPARSYGVHRSFSKGDEGGNSTCVYTVGSPKQWNIF